MPLTSAEIVGRLTLMLAVLGVLLTGAVLDVDQLTQAVTSLQSRVEKLEQDNKVASQRIAMLESQNERLRRAAVSTFGGQADGRQLSAAQCCRWTPDGTCGSVAAGRQYGCTGVHEYLEHKTTTHEFADIDACLTAGSEDSWEASFNGVTANVTLKSSGSIVANFPTPLKVLHAADCVADPTLEVQLAVNIANSLSLQGVDLTSQLLDLNPTNRVCIKTVTDNSGYAQFYVQVPCCRPSPAEPLPRVYAGTYAHIWSHVQDIHSPPGEFRFVAGDKFPSGNQATCFQGFIKLAAVGPSTDSWSGYVSASTDGGTAWSKSRHVSANTGSTDCIRRLVAAFCARQKIGKRGAASQIPPMRPWPWSQRPPKTPSSLRLTRQVAPPGTGPLRVRPAHTKLPSPRPTFSSSTPTRPTPLWGRAA